MADLRGARARAVLIGTGCATGNPGADGLDAIPAVRTTLTDLTAVLVERCGMAAENVRVLLDPAQPFAFGEALAEETAAAEDALLVYFCGHGLVSLDGDLYLATAATDRRAGYLAHTAAPYAQVRNAVLESPARVKVVVLDCCYSGRAFTTLGNTAGTEATGLSRIHGGYVLTAAGANEAALAPVGERHTAFGGELIRLLTEGDPDGPRDLTLQHVHAYLREMLPARGFPRPRRLATEVAEGFVLAPNPAYRLGADGDGREDSAVTGDEDVCPYRGLAAFDVGDTAWFFGRTRETREVLDRIGKAQPGDPPLVLVGPSGVGKSSLIRAGVAAGLAGGGFDGPERAPVLMTPGPRPLSALYTALGDRGTAPVLLVVDQFEEVFTECADPEDRESFVAAITGGLGDAVVLLGLRADFYRHCLAFPALREALERNQVLLGPLSGDELGTAVQAPAAAAGLTLQAGLVPIVLQDVQAQAEALAADRGDGLDLQQGEVLPLLAHALRETWVHRRGRLLTVTGYARSGRVARAVESSAEQVHAGLDEPGRAVLRTLVLRMAAVGEGTAVTRRLAPRDTLLDDLGPGAEPVLDALVAAGLVVVDGDAAGLAHSAVLQAWPRLRTWLEEGRQSLLVRRSLAAAAERWQQADRRPGLLYRGTRLALAGELAGPDEPPLPALSREFLDASTARRRRTRRRLVALATVAVLGAGTSVAVFARSLWGGPCPRGMQSSSSVSFGDECVGVTDGSYVFRPELAAVERRIVAENQRVGDFAATVAFLAPFPVAGTGALTVDSMRHQLEGAHAAQVEANRSGSRVKLLLANTGASGAAWEPVVGQLATSDPVGVIGMGVSSASTLDAVRELSARGLPVVAGIATADDFDATTLPGVVRVRPANRQLVAVMSRYVATQAQWRPRVLVADGDPGNLYARSLQTDIAEQIGSRPGTLETFGYLPGNASPAGFAVVTRGICAGRVESVFFAGRATDLPAFLASLAAGSCTDPVEVYVPESVDERLGPELRAGLAAAKVSVTAFVPAGWSALPGPDGETSPRYQRYREAFAGTGSDPAGAAAADAISLHDALRTMVTAYETAPKSRSSRARAARTQLGNLHGPLSVPGAEEDLRFTARGTPARQTVGIIRYTEGKPGQRIAIDHTDQE
ncbi:caspase, EACC1-associated type [Amycolatopsis sp. NPDC005003]